MDPFTALGMQFTIHQFSFATQDPTIHVDVIDINHFFLVMSI